jgi:hypothetical protein
MKITDKILSIPPYISTAWKNIASLRVEMIASELILIVDLTSGTQIRVPSLDRPTLERIFAAHTQAVEQESSLQKQVPFSFSISEGPNMPTSLQHNMEQADSPNLPPELLEKVSSMIRSMGVDVQSQLPKPEPHCNCPHCQIMRAVQEENSPLVEEEVTEEDLKFRSWDIAQEGEKLYAVTNPLDSKECYHVFLGDPLGCTCGEKTCEHIQAVLHT